MLQIGQILLTLPNAFAKTGLIAGGYKALQSRQGVIPAADCLQGQPALPKVLLGPAGLVLSISSACVSLWTMFMLIALYVERKQRLVSLRSRSSVQPGHVQSPLFCLPGVLPPLVS